MRQIKKALFTLHQATGAILSLMFVIWFLSGIVLIFDGYPHASREDRFLSLETFTKSDFERIQPFPDSIKGSGIYIEKHEGKPVYRLPAGKRAQKVYDAASHEYLASFSEKICRKQAESFTGSKTVKTKKINELDQWIPWSYYSSLLPVYKFYLDDEFHTVIYVSSKTGSIIQHTERKNRWLARVGAIPHWIYFKSLRAKIKTWESVIIWLSVIGIFVSLTGIIAGILRLKKRKQWKENGITPYKKFWFKWHHLTGFFFGLFVFTFILSGLFSVVDLPKRTAPKNEIFTPQKQWNKSVEIINHTDYQSLQLYRVLGKKEGVRKLEMEVSMGKPAWWVYYDNYQVPEIYLIDNDSVYKKSEFTLGEINKRAKQVFPKKDFKIDILREYNNYYQESGMKHHPLPVYRIQWDISSRDIIYFDPLTGEAIASFNRNKKIHRWLYQGLHKFNIRLLKQHEWLRKLLLIVLSIGGLAVSVTGVVLGWKWIKRIIKKQHK